MLPVCLGLRLNGIMACEVIQVAGEGGVLRSGHAPEIVVTTSVVGATSKQVKRINENYMAENEIMKYFFPGLLYP